MIRKSLILLTIQYSIFLLILFAIFNTSIYIYMVHTFDTDYNQTVKESDKIYKKSSEVVAKDVADEATDAGIARLKRGLIISSGGLVVLVPFISYGLARRSLKPLIRSYNAQQQFVDNASHELRTPLTRMQGELELALRANRTTEEYKKAMKISLKETEGMAKMVSSLLLLARGTSKEMDGSLQDIKIQTAISRALKSIDATYVNSTPTIINKVRRRPIIITAMPKLLEQALINILDNSVKFTPTTGTITIDDEVTATKVVIKISDNGRGMTKEEIKHAFDRLWRAKNIKPVMGHGLGLPFAKQVIEAHHGTATILANKDKGVTFKITLPLAS